MRAIVIGGGLAGLIAANRLADRGATVTVLEARARTGGRAASEHRDGFLLNRGPHALFLGGAAAQRLTALGIPFEGMAPQLDGALARRAGREHLLPTSPRALAASTLLPPRGKRELQRFLARAVRAEAEASARISAAEWLERELPRDDARAVAQALVRVATYTAAAEALSADAALAQLRIANTTGVRYLHGGWQSLVDALEARAAARGVRIHSRSRVDRIERRAHRWVVVTDKAELTSPVVVLAPGSPTLAARLARGIADTSGWTGEPAAYAAVLDLGLAALPRPRHAVAFGIDEPTYLSRHTPPGRAPGGRVLLTLAAYLRHDDDLKPWRARLEALADAVQPGWRERLTLERYLARMTVVSQLPSPSRGGLAGRPRVQVPDAPGLLLSGDWVGGHGLLADASVASGWEAAAAAAALADDRAIAA